MSYIYILKNIYVYVCTCACVTKINEKEAIDLKEIQVGYMGKSGGRKEKGKMM